MIGRKFDDPIVQAEQAQLPYEVWVCFKVQRMERRALCAEPVSAHIVACLSVCACFVHSLLQAE